MYSSALCKMPRYSIPHFNLTLTFCPIKSIKKGFGFTINCACVFPINKGALVTACLDRIGRRRYASCHNTITHKPSDVAKSRYKTRQSEAYHASPQELPFIGKELRCHSRKDDGFFVPFLKLRTGYLQVTNESEDRDCGFTIYVEATYIELARVSVSPSTG